VLEADGDEVDARPGDDLPEEADRDRRGGGGRRHAARALRAAGSRRGDAEAASERHEPRRFGDSPRSPRSPASPRAF